MKPLPVYDVVLLPPARINDAAIEVSQKMRTKGTEFTLESESRYPHISLYMANFRQSDVPRAISMLAEIARVTPALPLAATHYGCNSEGMFEIFYQKTPGLITLQEAVIRALNGLRQGLREKDPVGHVLQEWISQTSEVARHNLLQYGYDEVGKLFKPHITFTRFQRRELDVPQSGLPPAETFSGTYSLVALCVMGEHGTCTEVVASWPLAS